MWCPRRGCCFLSNLRGDLGHAEEATPPRGEPGLRRPPTPRAASIPPARPPGISALTAPGTAPAERSPSALRAGGSSSCRGTGATAGPSTRSPRPPPPPPCGEAGRAPAVPPQPTPGRALAPRPGPASITSHSTFEWLSPRRPPAPACAASPVLPLYGSSFTPEVPGSAAPPGRPPPAAIPPSRGRDPHFPGQRPPRLPGAAAAPPAVQSPGGAGETGTGGSLPAGVSLITALQPEQPGSNLASPAEPPGSSRGRQRFLRHLRPSRRLRTPAFPPWLLRCLSGGNAEACAGSWVEGSHRLLFLCSPLSLWASSCHVSPQAPSRRSPKPAVSLCPDPKLLGLFLFSAAPCHPPSACRGHGFCGGPQLCAAAGPRAPTTWAEGFCTTVV